jgi:tetratricopeptide (TPR) repeat protein
LAHAGDLDGALTHAIEAVDLGDDNGVCWKVLARVHAARGSFQDALYAFHKGRPYDAESNLHAAFVYATASDGQARNGKKAVAIYEATTRAFPRPVPPHLNLVGACCYAEAGNFDKAVELAQSAVEQSPAGSSIETSARHLLNLFQNRQPYRLDRDRTLRPFDLPVLEHIIPKTKPEVSP